MRSDIQGLRAVAVAIVVIFHLDSSWLPGGYVGVDVFFVISGFLITLHLVQRPPASGADLATFWGRRVRRLLPASLLVLATTLVLSRLVAAETQWANTAKQAGAATLYVVNWLLADDSVDYLAAENAASPVQHFWSLSVEEQFYFVWPLIIFAAVLLARRFRRRVLGVVLLSLTGLVLASLAYSITETASNPAAAYFVTPTRMWELGVGGLLAVATRMAPRFFDPAANPGAWRAPVAWAGLALIAWSAITYSGATPFPGWQAAVPVLGTAMVLGAEPPERGPSPGFLLARPSAQWLGDVSYSVYLWHWPLIVLAPQALGREANLFELGLIAVLTLLLAWGTKLWVEDRFRASHWGLPRWKPFALGGVGMAIVLVMVAAQLGEVDRRTEQARAEVTEALEDGGPCFGARALDDPAACPPVAYDEILPAPAEAANDRSDAYREREDGTTCWAESPRFRDRDCTYGDPDGDVDVALVGNSHSGQWLPALDRIARANGWRVTTHMASACVAADVPQQLAIPSAVDGCLDWVGRTTQRVLDSRPDAVVYSNRIFEAVEGEDSVEASVPAYEEGMRTVLERWSRADIPVLVLHDTPASGESTPDCLAENPDDVTACDGTREEWINPEPARDAVASLEDPQVRFVDLNDHICGPEVCAAVTGGVVTYFDASHLTATFASTMAPYLEPPLTRLLRDTGAL